MTVIAVNPVANLVKVSQQPFPLCSVLLTWCYKKIVCQTWVSQSKPWNCNPLIGTDPSSDAGTCWLVANKFVFPAI